MCTCQDFTRRNYAYLSTLGLYKKPQFAKAKASTIKPGRTEEMINRGNVLNAAQQQLTNIALGSSSMTIIYPSGEDNRFSVLGVSLTESGKILEDPKIYTEIILQFLMILWLYLYQKFWNKSKWRSRG